MHPKDCLIEDGQLGLVRIPALPNCVRESTHSRNPWSIYEYCLVLNLSRIAELMSLAYCDTARIFWDRREDDIECREKMLATNRVGSRA